VKSDISTGKADLGRFITIPLICTFIPIVSGRGALYFFPNWKREITILVLIMKRSAQRVQEKFQWRIRFDRNDMSQPPARTPPANAKTNLNMSTTQRKACSLYSLLSFHQLCQA